MGGVCSGIQHAIAQTPFVGLFYIHAFVIFISVNGIKIGPQTCFQFINVINNQSTMPRCTSLSLKPGIITGKLSVFYQKIFMRIQRINPENGGTITIRLWKRDHLGGRDSVYFPPGKILFASCR
ncbi:MAG: hypothetical protein ACK41Q_03990 [Candidatus Brocadia sp.]